ncbi:MAG: hypothetical protein K8I60_06955 [Anaerolineae bacterium]|nr:hypothetical protein [Anaerolineae bacterium]
MGLDASVMCNCYQEGKTTPCPFPEHFHIDGDGFPALNLPYDHHEAESDAFDQWLATCCEHPYMEHTALYISNWKGYRSFKEALEQIGWEHFPTLRRCLPESNQGTVTAEASAKALKELEAFKIRGNAVRKTFLINSETDEIIGASTAAYGGKFGWNGRTGMNIGFDEQGFFIQDAWEFNREIFRAMRFEQRIIESDALDRPRQFEYVDLATGRTFLCSTPVRVFVEAGDGQLHQEYPHQMHVEQRMVGATYHDYILEPLTKIFEASVATGNPVRWS